MADLPQPYFDPSQYPAYLDAQRKQQLAQMLMGSLQSANQTPASWDSMKVVPKRGLMQNASVLADALLARKGLDASNQATAQYMQGLYGGGQPATPDTAMQGPPTPGAAPSSGIVQQPAQNPMIPAGVPKGVAMAAVNADPKEYFKSLLSYYQGTPEWQNAVRMNGGNVQAAMQQLQAEARVKGTTHMRQGEDVQLPDGTTIRNPVLGSGETLTRDAQGNPQSVSLIPGAADAAGTLKGAQTAAEVANTPKLVPQGGGVEKLMYPGDAGGPGTPPALRPAAQPPISALQPKAAPSPPALAAAASTALPQKDQNGIISNNLWPNIPKMQIPVTPGQTTSTYQQKIQDSSAAKHQELVNKFGEGSAAGTQQLEYLTEAERALPKAEVGPMTEYLTHNRGMLIEAFPSLKGALGSGTVTPTLELNKQLTNAALQGARTTFGSRMTQNEVKLQTDEMSPSAGMTRDALVSLINQAKMKAAYGIQQDKDYSDYHAAGGDPNRFESQYNVKRPITRFSSQYATPPAALDRLKQNPAMLNDFKSKYGWDPTQ